MVSLMSTFQSLFLNRKPLYMPTVKLVRMNRTTTNLFKPMSLRLPYLNNVPNASIGQGQGGFIRGRTLEKDVPISRRVMCYHRRTGELISKTWSDADGYFTFENLEPGIELYITSIDSDGNRAAVTQDLLTAV